MKFSPASCYFIPVRSKYSPQHTVLRYLCSSLNIRVQVSHPYKTTGKTGFEYFNFYPFRQQTRRRKFLNWMVASITGIQYAFNFLTNQVEALCYKPESRGFDSRWSNWIFNWPNPSSHTMALGSTQPITEMDTRNLPEGKGRPAHGAENLTAICEPIV
jgi:hypothetical protein